MGAALAFSKDRSLPNARRREETAKPLRTRATKIRSETKNVQFEKRRDSGLSRLIFDLEDKELRGLEQVMSFS